MFPSKAFIFTAENIIVGGYDRCCFALECVYIYVYDTYMLNIYLPTRLAANQTFIKGTLSPSSHNGPHACMITLDDCKLYNNIIIIPLHQALQNSLHNTATLKFQNEAR